MGSAIDGSYAAVVAVPAANAYAIGDSVTYEEAAAKEKSLAEELRAEGYAVWQN